MACETCDYLSEDVSGSYGLKVEWAKLDVTDDLMANIEYILCK